SSDRRLLAVVMSDVTIALVDLVAGEHVGTLQIADKSWDAYDGRLAFRDDNLRLASSSHAGLKICDLPTGKQIWAWSQSEMRASDPLCWAANFILMGGQYLFDSERRILLWEYSQPFRGFERAIFQRGMIWAIAPLNYNTEPTLYCGF